MSKATYILLFVFTFSVFDFSFAQSPASVITSNGRVIGSVRNFDGQDYQEFLGIPYAKPPIGELRFRKPEPPSNWTDLDATTYGFACWQPQDNDPFLFSVYTGNANTKSEDCLTLNVFVPGNHAPGALLPVIVVIHGGGFVIGHSALYPGHQLALAGDVIVVTINYRLGIFGFMSFGTPGIPGNYGLWDQLMALKWINKNIGSFGGDQNNITLMGQSAGAASANLLSITPKSKGLFRRVIIQSGNALAQWAITPPKIVFEPTLSTLKSLNPFPCKLLKLVECLRNEIDAEALFNASLPFLFDPEPSISRFSFIPVVDNDLFKEHPLKTLRNTDSEGYKLFSSLDMMIGTTDAEGGVFLYNYLRFPEFLPFNINDGFPHDFAVSIIQNMTKVFFPSNPEGVYNAVLDRYFNNPSAMTDEQTAVRLVHFLGDWGVIAPTVQILKSHGNGNGSTYQYFFTHAINLPQNHTAVIPQSPPWYPGANHFAEVPYVLGLTFYHFYDSFTAGEFNLSKTMMQHWTNFAKTGNPGAPWPQYDKVNKRYMEFKVDPVVKDDLLPSRVRFWLKTIPGIAGKPTNTGIVECIIDILVHLLLKNDGH